MKKFHARKNCWQGARALGFFANFIQNCHEEIEDSDVFRLVIPLQSDSDWSKLIRETFPAGTLARLQNIPNHINRLDFEDEPKIMLRAIWNSGFARARLVKMLKNIIAARLREKPASRYLQESCAVRFRELQQTLKLTDFEAEVLLVLYFINRGLLCLDSGLFHFVSNCDKATFVAANLDCEPAEVMAALSEQNRLRRYECVDNDFDFNGDLSRFLDGITTEPLVSSYFIRCRDEVLPWDFYGTLSEKHGTILKRIISSAAGRNAVNILLYGAPGTGKTSFAKTLAAELKRDCYMIRQSNCSYDENIVRSPSWRFGALQICAGRLDASDSIIIVDEADEMLRCGMPDLFNVGSGMTAVPGAGDKGLLNSMLDTIKIPTIWITNSSAGELDLSSRRRFDYSIRFDPLNEVQRQSIWRNNVKKMGMQTLVPPELQAQFSRRYPVSAGGIARTLQNLARLAPQPAEVETLTEQLLAPHCELLGIQPASDKLAPSGDYSLTGLNIRGDLSLERVAAAVRRYQQSGAGDPDQPRMNLLLSGPPGSGKTEFVKYLGRELNTRVVVRMGSDLLDMYVGNTEKNIRAAFAQAEAEKAILFLDEFDGLLQNRERARQSWEVTQVNELLHQLENFSGVMIGATNFSARLDRAVLRRFTFKLEFDYLDDAGKKIFFERMFRTVLTPEEEQELAAIPRLTPGDFRTVRQSLFYLDGPADNRTKLAALARESAAKRDGNSGARAAIGF